MTDCVNRVSETLIGEENEVRKERGSVDQIFAHWQVVEKVYAPFTVLEKAHNKANKRELWEVLILYVMLRVFLTAIKSFPSGSRTCGGRTCGGRTCMRVNGSIS